MAACVNQIINFSTNTNFLQKHALLYRAQASATEAVKTIYFPCYLPEYVASQKGIKGAALRCYSSFYDAIEAIVSKINFFAQTLFHSIQSKDAFCSDLSKKLQKAANSMVELLQTITTEINEEFQECCGSILLKIRDLLFPLNPMKGKRQFSLVPRKVEKVLGDWLIYPLTTKDYFETSECLTGTKEQVKTRVNQIAKRLFAKNADLLNPPGKCPFNYRIKTVKSELNVLNAFSVAGGGMVVFNELVQELKGAIDGRELENAQIKLADGSVVKVDLRGVTLDDALAAIIGHETTHVASRHTVAGIAFSLIWAVLDWIRDTLFPMNQSLYLLSYAVKKRMENFLSRRSEIESDVGGAYLMHQANFNILGALYAQEFLLRKESEWAGFFHKHLESNFTHPHGSTRLRALFAAIGEIAPEILHQHTIRIEDPKKIESLHT